MKYKVWKKVPKSSRQLTPTYKLWIRRTENKKNEEKSRKTCWHTTVKLTISNLLSFNLHHKKHIDSHFFFYLNGLNETRKNINSKAFKRRAPLKPNSLRHTPHIKKHLNVEYSMRNTRILSKPVSNRPTKELTLTNSPATPFQFAHLSSHSGTYLIQTAELPHNGTNGSNKEQPIEA